MTNYWFSKNVIIVYALSMLALAEIVDLTIVAVAIPQIMGSLGADLSSIAMVTTSYIVAAAVFIPLSGIFIRKYGMKRVILTSTVIFTISSILCGIVTSLTGMIIFRAIQGMGGAFLPSVAQSFIAKNFKDEQLKQMTTLFGIIIVMGPVIGPILGGSLSENLSWRWVFYVNVPICIIGFIMVFLFMDDDPGEPIKVDYISFAFMVFGIGALEYFIDEGNRNAWFNSIPMVTIFIFSILSLIFFVWRGLGGKSVIDFSLFKNTNFVFSCLSMFLFMMFVMGAFAYFPTMLQQLYGFPADAAGYISAPRGITALLSAPIIPKISQRIGIKFTMFLGMLIFAFTCFALSKNGIAINHHRTIGLMMLQGFAMMCFYLPILEVCFIGFNDEQISSASGVFNFFRNFSCSIGNSICATIVSHQLQVNYNDMGTHISPYATGYSWWVQHLSNTPEHLQLAIAQGQMSTQALLLSYLDSYYLFGVLILCILWLPFTLKSRSTQIHV